MKSGEYNLRGLGAPAGQQDANTNGAGPADAPPVPGPQAALKLRSANWSAVKPVDFLDDGRIPKGKLGLLVGEEGGGKGTLEAHLTARAIMGRLNGEPTKVLIIGDEDGFEDTWIPRIFAAIAELDPALTEQQIKELIDKRVFTLDTPEALSMASDRGRLDAAIEENGIGWVILDQALDNLDGGRGGEGIYNAKHVRQQLLPWRHLARDRNIAVTANLHPIKGNPKSFRDMIGGSHQFNAVSRASLWLGSDPDRPGDNESRVLVRGKGNLSAEPKSYDFRIVSKTVKIGGQAFEMPVVVDAHDGTRYRSDFEGGRGAGFGQSKTVPAAESNADKLEPLLTDEYQGASALAKRSGVGRTAVYPAMELLVERGVATYTEGRGWKRADESDKPALD